MVMMNILKCLMFKGELAQLVERLVYTEIVGGSIPSLPTIWWATWFRHDDLSSWTRVRPPSPTLSNKPYPAKAGWGYFV